MTIAGTAEKSQHRFGVRDEPSVRGAQRVVWFGPHRIALDDIISVEGKEVHDRPVAGLVTAASAFIVLAAVFAFLVFDDGWRDRYLIATALFTALGAAGICEAIKAKPNSFFDVQIKTRAGGIVSFASADAAEVSDFVDMLERAGVSARRAA